MNNKIRKIRAEIFSFVDEVDGNIIENEHKYYKIEDVVKYVGDKYGVDIKLRYVGGFDSPGYDVLCYAWAGIVDGELYFDSLMQENICTQILMPLNQSLIEQEKCTSELTKVHLKSNHKIY